MPQHDDVVAREASRKLAHVEAKLAKLPEEDVAARAKLDKQRVKWDAELTTKERAGTLAPLPRIFSAGNTF